MSRMIILIGVFLLVAPARTQTPGDFVSLRCRGSVPDDFTKLSSKKYEEDLAANTDADLDKDFFLSTRFFFDELLLSGQVLFNDPISEYINKVADYVLVNEPSLRNELRFYVLRSNTPNAFSTDQGIILFTTGLMAQLESEAQLAFILSHEVSHYTEKHVRSEYVENQLISKGRGRYGNLNYDKRVNEISTYSKELELEADEKGLERYLETEYDLNEAFTAFEVLHYSYLPFDDIGFDTNFFSTPYLQVPGSFFPDTINQISKEMDYNDHGHTHPNIQRRIDKSLDLADGKSSKGDKKFVISEETFFSVRDLARFEGVNIALSSREYGRALYDIFLLKQRFTENRFLDLAFVKALYGLMKYKNHSRYSEVIEKTSKVEGESYKLHLFLKKISKQQLNVLAFRHANDMAARYPGDEIFVAYLEDTKKELAIHSGIDADDFKAVSLQECIESSKAAIESFDVQDSIRKIDESDLSKYEKIRRKKELNALLNNTGVSITDEQFHLYGLYDLVSGTSLVSELKTLKREEQEERERLAAAEDDYVWDENTKHLGIDKLVVVDPIYDNYRLNSKKNHLKSEDKKISVSDMYTASYSGLDLETTLVDSKNLGSGSVDEYNDLGVLFRWISEVVEHDDITMINSSRDQMNVLTEKYGTDHFLFSGISAYKARKEMGAAHWYGIMAVYTIPLVLVDLIIVHNYFELVAIEINAANDRVEFAQATDVNLKGIDGILKAYIYDVLYQLSSDPKKTKNEE